MHNLISWAKHHHALTEAELLTGQDDGAFARATSLSDEDNIVGLWFASDGAASVLCLVNSERGIQGQPPPANVRRANAGSARI